MIQTFTSSRFSSSLQHLQRENGFFTWLQPQRRHTRHTKILNGDKEKKYRGLCCHNILDSTERFSSGCNKPRTHGNLLVQTFGATSDGEFVLQPSDDHKVTLQSNLWKQWDAFYRFCRLYTVIGMIVEALIPYVFANIYVGGINQLVDVEIDKINKPYYPLAAGEYSMGQGKAIVSAFGFTCLAMGIMFQSPPLFIGILVFFLLGTAYSIELPLLRWKTNPYLAVLCIVGAQLTIQRSVFYHIQDIPDVEGDRAFGNRTFSVRHGKKKVFHLCVSILLIAYGCAVVIGASSSFLLCKLVSVIGHCTVASFLLLRAKSLNLNDDASTQSFYIFLWKLFSAEYVLIQFIR